MSKKLDQKVFVFKPHNTPTPLPSEDVEQINCASWFRHKYPDLTPLCFHPVNESKSTPHYRHKVAKKGLQPGVADWVILKPSKGYAFACIEIKRASKSAARLSPAQIEHLNAVANNGGYAAVAYGFEAFKISVEKYFT